LRVNPFKSAGNRRGISGSAGARTRNPIIKSEAAGKPVFDLFPI
jgi:hypothetical protein